MKKFKILILIMIVSNQLFAQFSWVSDTISFETPDSLVSIDTSNIGNIWQIGSPHKLFFDSAYSVPNAILTDTINYYPPNNTSSFILKTYYPFPGYLFLSVSFEHKYETDSLQDGGYIEISYDGGVSWINIANDPRINYSYSGNAILANGNAAFTGKSYSSNNGWVNDGIIIGCPEIILDSELLLKFVFSSDSIQTNKEGWMIDNIMVYNDFCEGINEIKNNDLISIFPNPTKDHLYIRRKINKNKSSIQIYNFNGQLVFEDNNFSQNEVDTKQFSNGIYLLKYSDSINYSLKKFIIE